MFIKLVWKKEVPETEMQVLANPEKKVAVENILRNIREEKMFTVIEERSNRSIKVRVSEIEMILSDGSRSMVVMPTIKGDYYLQKRIKELGDLSKYGIIRINQSMLLNIKQIKSFSVIDNARLEVETVAKNRYIVSRSYAKKIKEDLSC